MSSIAYTSGIFELLINAIGQADCAVMLATNEYQPDAAHETRSDVERWEVSGAGYLSGGGNVDVSVTLDKAGGCVVVDLGGYRWERSRITARYGIYFRRNGSLEDDALIACIDFKKDIETDGAAFSLEQSKLRLQT